MAQNTYGYRGAIERSHNGSATTNHGTKGWRGAIEKATVAPAAGNPWYHYAQQRIIGGH